VLPAEFLCGLIPYRSSNFNGEFRWDFVHPVGRARVLGALLQNFLLGLPVGDEVAIHSHIPTIDCLCHPAPSLQA
jgi:hypothetical protein